MNGYPAGTKCVITWGRPGRGFFIIGRLTTCLDTTPGTKFTNLDLWPADITPQANILDGHSHISWHPAEWMRPLEDPGTIEDDIEAILELTGDTNE